MNHQLPVSAMLLFTYLGSSCWICVCLFVFYSSVPFSVSYNLHGFLHSHWWHSNRWPPTRGPDWQQQQQHHHDHHHHHWWWFPQAALPGSEWQTHPHILLHPGSCCGWRCGLYNLQEVREEIDEVKNWNLKHPVNKIIQYDTRWATGGLLAKRQQFLRSPSDKN